MIRPNILSAQFESDEDDPSGYRSGEAKVGGMSVGSAAGGKELAVRMFELPAGQSLCPYHYEYSEEWLLVLSGDLELRTPAGTEQLAAGDLACFPPGPQGAHKVTTRSDQPARFMMWSRRASPEVVVYPDSDKVAVFTDTEEDEFMFTRGDANKGYYDGEL